MEAFKGVRQTLFAAAILSGIALFVYLAAKESEIPVSRAESTNFSAEGLMMFDNPGQANSRPRVVYDREDGAGVSKALAFDALSVCAAVGGATPCMAMSVTLDIPFGGKRVLVQGIERADGSVLVRKLERLEPGEIARLPDPGIVYISWPQAVSHIEKCEANMVMQSHNLDVSITLKDGSRVRAVEPVLDEVFSVIERSRSSCGAIPIATE